MSKKAFRIRLQEDSQHHLSAPLTAEAAADRDDLETLSLVVSRSGNAILILNEHAEIEWSNQAFEKQSGYPTTEILGSKLDSLVFGPSTYEATRNRFHQAFQNGHEFTEDVLQYRKDGKTLWVELKLIPVYDEHGRISRWISLQTDITRRRRTQEALLAAKQSAESSSRAKSDFLANMSHEIRTPMNAILGMTDLALSTDLTKEQRDYLTTVRTSANSLLGILNDVLDISKIEAGKMELESLDFNLDEVVRETLRALSVRAHEKGLELAAQMPTGIPNHLKGDPVRLRQVLFNLVDNAIKFTHQGEVVVSVEQQWSSASEVSLHFTVSDTGIGIPQSRLEKIFDSFSQVDSSMARRFGGSGLGLTITAQLLELMHGKIWVQSEEGEGSSFHFTLQLRFAEDPPKADLAFRETLQGLNILVVDDNATSCKVLEDLLRNWGMQPTCVSSANAAIEKLQANEGTSFDIVLLDAIMPEVDGFELAEQLTKSPEHNASTVMMLSSADRTHATNRCRELGVGAYLMKPVTSSALMDALLESVGHEAKEASKNATFNEESIVPRKVLIVDDYEPNRVIASEVLGRRGHQCEQVSDGERAVKRIFEEQFDVVLMDVQMPSMDGLMATRKVRSLEEEGKRTRIVGLTAHALAGDREKCLEAGMDDYLPKPFHSKRLVAVIEQESPATSTSSQSEKVLPTAEKEERFSIAKALERMGDEQDLLVEHIKYTINDLPILLSNMRSAVQADESRPLEIAAHRLKSLVSSYDFHAAQQIAQEIESLARDKVPSDFSTRIEELENQLESFIGSLKGELRNFDHGRTLVSARASTSSD